MPSLLFTDRSFEFVAAGLIRSSLYIPNTSNDLCIAYKLAYKGSVKCVLYIPLLLLSIRVLRTLERFFIESD